MFDLDRTLTRRGTYLGFLLFTATHVRPWRLAFLPAVIGCMAAYKLRVFERTRLKELMQRLLLGPSLDGGDARRIAGRFAARLLARGLHPQGRARIAFEQAAGHLVVIATAAPELYVRPLADLLGVEHVVATRSVWRGDRLLSRIEGRNCYGPEKLARVEGFLAEQGVEAGVRVRVFSDDVSDRPLLERCDDPVAVNPGRALRRLARERGWPVLDWRSASTRPERRRQGAADARLFFDDVGRATGVTMTLDRNPAQPGLWLGIGFLAVLLLAATRLWLVPVHVSFNPNEGWNAFQAARAMGAGPLYPDPHGLTGNNYPPLSFYIVGLAGEVVGDPIVAGRLLCVAAVCAVAAGVHRVVARLSPGSRTLPWLGALLVLGFNATQYRTYFAMNDPQWMAHAFMTAGLALLIPAAPQAPVRLATAAAAAALMLVGGLIKHNLVAFPLAATLWLALHHRPALWAWLATAVAGVVLAAALGVWLCGPDMIHGILGTPRHTSWLRMWRSSSLPLASSAPMLAVSIGLARTRGSDKRVDLVLLAIGLGLTLGVLQRSGQGVNVNAHFEGLIALCIGAPAALARIGPERRLGRAWAGALLAAPFLVLVPVTIRDASEQLAHWRSIRGAWTQMQDRIARTSGPAVCETVALCYWAGKPFSLDTFLYGQKALATGDTAELRRALAEGRFGAIERDKPRPDPLPGDAPNPILPLLDRAGPVVFTGADGRRLIVPEHRPG